MAPEFLQPHIDNIVALFNGIVEYLQLDLQYMEFWYLFWLFLPIILAFVLPVLLILFIYGCVIFLHIYQLRNRILEAYASSLWDGARTSIASFWDGVGMIWHGYEVDGLENIPDNGPALIVAYHGTLPIDIVFLFTPGTIEDCVSSLKEGNLLIIAPGGVREALFSSTDKYEIMWDGLGGKRLGFAKVVLGADVPVIPMFTENSRDAFRTPGWGRKLFRRIYEKSRMPLCPIYGGFPVKMITHLGKAIIFQQNDSPEWIRDSVKDEIEALVREHQRLPGCITRAVLQRILRKKSTKVDAKRATIKDVRDDAELHQLSPTGEMQVLAVAERKTSDSKDISSAA